MRQKLASVVPRKVLLKIFFSEIFDFSKKNRFFKISKKKFFIKTLRGATEASFCRTKLLLCSFFQKFAILCVWNKIKVVRTFEKHKKYQSYREKIRFFVFCHRFRKVVCSVKPEYIALVGKKRGFFEYFVLFEKFCQNPVE